MWPQCQQKRLVENVTVPFFFLWRCGGVGVPERVQHRIISKGLRTERLYTCISLKQGFLHLLADEHINMPSQPNSDTVTSN